MRERDFDKEATVMELLGQGWTYKEIGAKLGVSKQRVYQILFRYRHPQASTAYNDKQFRDDRNNRVLELIDLGIAINEVALIMRLAPASVRSIMRDNLGSARDAKKYRTDTIKRLMREGADTDRVVKEVYGITLA
jgi:DNA-binding NarL/FixJ family response regulator